MADILAGHQIETGWWPESVTVTENTDQNDVSSTSSIAGSPECSMTFIAPHVGPGGCRRGRRDASAGPGR